MAEGDYVVLCDQDDIWEPNRVEVSLNHMLEEGSILDVCDRSVIDENGNILVKSYRKAHPNSPEVIGALERILLYRPQAYVTALVWLSC